MTLKMLYDDASLIALPIKGDTMSKYGIGNYLDISTYHISEETLYSNSSPYLLAEYDSGAIYWVPDEDEHMVPDDLKIVFDYARKSLCSLVRFDADGFQFPELPEYDWQ